MPDLGRTETPLKRVLREQGRRQDWLAEQLGVDPSQVSHWVNGRHRPQQETRVEIARHLGRTVDELWPVEPEEVAA